MVQMPAYLAWMGGSLALSCLMYGLMARKCWGGRGAARTALWTCLLSGLLGAGCARLGYVLLRIDIFPWGNPLRAVTEWDVNTLSYYGGAAGVALGAALAAGSTGKPVKEALGLFAPAGALLAALARFGEGFLGMLGVGMYLEDGFFPLAVRFTWDGEWFESYLAVFVLEGVFSLAACALSLVHRKDSDRFRRTVFYLCLPQILLESLRMQSISWLFVRAEQLTCFLICEGILVALALQSGRRGPGRWTAPVIGLAVCAVVIVGEFALDGKISLGERDIPPLAIYGVEALGLAAMAWAEHHEHRMRLR